MNTFPNTPYYDDFEGDKNFNQILFKPGFSVQARELTQLQSILRDQITKFGNHIFKHGSVVIPGNSNSDLNVCYVKLVSTTVNVSLLEGSEVVGGTTGLRGIIRKGIVATGVDPATLYVSYYNSGINGEKLFLPSEQLTVNGSVFTTVSVSPCGGASMAFLNAGVFYVNGTFVSTTKQSIVIDKYSSLPSCRVLLKITESIVNSDSDATLLDPAQGSYNYAAPGADRLKISLTLTTLPLTTVIAEDYIEIMRYNEGVLEEHLRYAKYSELEKSLARRTSDESGDYVVSGLRVSTREHIKRGINGGRYDLPIGDSDKVVVTTSAGKAYIKGFEQDIISPREVTIDKARDTSHLATSTTSLAPSFGQTFFVTNITGLPSFKSKTTVNIYNASASGVLIGTAQVISIDYYAPNSTDTNAIFKLCVSDVDFGVGYDVEDVGQITFSGGSFVVLNRITTTNETAISFVVGEVVTYNTRGATVHKYDRSIGELFVFKHSSSIDVPVIGDNITGPSGATGRINSSEILTKNSNDTLLIGLPSTSTYRVKNDSNVVDVSYKIYHETSVNINSSGVGSFSVSGMTIDPKEQGNFIISAASGILLPLSIATVAVDGLSVSFAGAPASSTIKIICAATKSGANATPKTKTLSYAYIDSGLVPSALVQLTRTDIVRLVSVVSTIDGNVTNRYKLDNGQRDYAYLRGTLSLKSGAITPTGTLSATYDYFIHNSGSGDYFSVDSYESSGMDDYFDNPLLVYTSSNTNKSFDLRDMLDFRPSVGVTGTFTSGSPSLSNVAQLDSRLTTSYQQYVGRIDVVVLSKDTVVSVVRGTPARSPATPPIPAGVMRLAVLYVPAYTYDVSSIKINRIDNRVYTMADIGKISTRLKTLEDVVLLTESEKSVVDYTIIDAATGLSRYKSGYLVDTFENRNIISDHLNPKFKVSYTSGNIIPSFDMIEAPIFITNNTGVIVGNALTLPYTSVPMISQTVSSKITNINPFAVFSWIGDVIIVPENDIWTETTNLPTITETVVNVIEQVNTTTVINTIDVIETIDEVTVVDEAVTVNRPYDGPLPQPNITFLWDGSPDLRENAVIHDSWGTVSYDQAVSIAIITGRV